MKHTKRKTMIAGESCKKRNIRINNKQITNLPKFCMTHFDIRESTVKRPTSTRLGVLTGIEICGFFEGSQLFMDEAQNHHGFFLAHPENTLLQIHK